MKKLINHPENVVVEALVPAIDALKPLEHDTLCASSVLLLESLREAARSAP